MDNLIQGANINNQSSEDEVVVKKVGKYVLFKILGRGTFGVVYLG
jgi:hypothetical protein